MSYLIDSYINFLVEATQLPSERDMQQEIERLKQEHVSVLWHVSELHVNIRTETVAEQHADGASMRNKAQRSPN